MRVDPSDTIGHLVPGASSARKLLSVLFCFTPERPVWTAAELSATLDVSTSTMYRYVALLREVGLLESTGSNSYGVGERVVTLARAVQNGKSSLEDLSIPVMTRIRDASGETVLVARRRRDYAYCVDRVESLKPVRLQFDRGQPMPLHRGSMARVLLAAMPKTDRSLYLQSIESEITGANAELLTSESLDSVAESGFTQSFEEVDEGIWGAAAAIVVGGETIASIGVAAPIYRLDVRQRESIVDEIKRGAMEISRSMELHSA